TALKEIMRDAAGVVGPGQADPRVGEHGGGREVGRGGVGVGAAEGEGSELVGRQRTGPEADVVDGPSEGFARTGVLADVKVAGGGGLVGNRLGQGAGSNKC